MPEITVEALKEFNKLPLEEQKKVAAQVPAFTDFLALPDAEKNRIVGAPISPKAESQALAESALGGSFFAGLVPEVPAIGGGIGGGIMGAKLPVPWWARPITAGVGAAIGGGVGELVKQEAQQVLGQPTPETPSERLQAAALAGGISGVSELAFGGLGALFTPVKTFVRTFGKPVVSGAKNINQELGRFGTRLSVAQTTESTILDIADNVARSGVLSAGGMRQFAQKQARGLQAYADEVVGKYVSGVPRADVGEVFTTALVRNRDLNENAVKGLYSALDNTISNRSVVDISDIEKLMSTNPELNQIIRGVFKSTLDTTPEALIRKSHVSVTRPDILGELGQVVKAGGTHVEKKPLDITFSQAQSMRSDILKQARALEEKGQLSTIATSKLGKLEEFFDTRMETAATQNGLVNDWRAANEAAKTFKETFHNDLIKSLIRRDDDFKVSEKLFKLRSPKDIRAIKDVVDVDTFNEISNSYLAEIFRQSSKVTNELSPLGSTQTQGQLLKDVLKNTPRETLKEFIGETGIARIERLADALYLVQKKEAIRTGVVATELLNSRGLMQLGAGGGAILLGTATDRPEAAIVGGAILLTPILASKLVRSEAGLKLLLEGMTPSTMEKAAKISTKIIGLLGLRELAMPKPSAQERQTFMQRLSEQGFTGGAPAQEQQAMPPMEPSRLQRSLLAPRGVVP